MFMYSFTCSLFCFINLNLLHCAFQLRTCSIRHLQQFTPAKGSISRTVTVSTTISIINIMMNARPLLPPEEKEFNRVRWPQKRDRMSGPSIDLTLTKQINNSKIGSNASRSFCTKCRNYLTIERTEPSFLLICCFTIPDYKSWGLKTQKSTWRDQFWNFRTPE